MDISLEQLFSTNLVEIATAKKRIKIMNRVDKNGNKILRSSLKLIQVICDFNDMDALTFTESKD